MTFSRILLPSAASPLSTKPLLAKSVAAMGLLALVSAHQVQAAPLAASAKGVDTSLILVKIGSGTSGSSSRAAFNTSLRSWSTRNKAKVGRALEYVGWQLVRLPAGQSASTAIASLKKQGIVASPNAAYKALSTPSDPYYNRQWNMEKIGAPAAWDVTTGLKAPSDVVVGVIDSGVDVTHPDLKNNLWKNPGEIPGNGIDDDHNGYVDDVYGYDFVSGDPGIGDNSGVGHGTHVSGIIGATANNKIGLAGVSWGVKIVNCKAINNYATVSSIAESFNYLLTLKARGVNIRVINHSYGGGGNYQPTKDAFQAASDAGILNIVAAGNGGDDGLGDNNDRHPVYPAVYNMPGLVTVAASDDQDQPSEFTNYGVKTVKIAAPGVGILSTVPGGYEYLDGTSMASPTVAGAVALLLSQRPDLSMTEAENLLLSSVDKLPQWRARVSSGGRLNLGKMLSGSVYAITGNVTDKDGKGLAGATVVISSHTLVSDRLGHFALTSLDPGTYKAAAKLNGYTVALKSPSTSPVVVASPKYNNTVNFIGTPTRTTYSISGTATDTLGQVVPGVAIYAGDPSQTQYSQPLAITDAKGRYTITGITGGRYKMQARAGTSELTAVGSATAASVTLPAKGDAAPNATLDWLLPLVDTKAPVVQIYTPRTGAFYVATSEPPLTARVFDNYRVASASLQISGEQKDSLGESLGYVYYNWHSRKFESYNFNNAAYYTLSSRVDKLDTPISFRLPVMPEGNFTAQLTATDWKGLTGGSSVNFDIHATSTTAPVPQYPTAFITAPYNGQKVKAGSISFQATGSATYGSKVESVTIYLQSLAEDGSVTAYYDWDAKVWTDWPYDTDQASLSSPSGYLTIPTSRATKVNWAAKLPPLEAGRYRLSAFARGVDFNVPPTDGSEDARAYFTVTGSGVPSPNPVDPIPTMTPVPTPKPSGSTS